MMIERVLYSMVVQQLANFSPQTLHLDIYQMSLNPWASSIADRQIAKNRRSGTFDERKVGKQ